MPAIAVPARAAARRSRPATIDLPRAAQLFHALSDATRLGILAMLRDGERCVCDLQDALDAAQSRLSFHLKVLKDAGLVTDRKEGRWSYYAIAPAALGTVHDVVVALHPGASVSDAVPGAGIHRTALRVVAGCCG